MPPKIVYGKKKTVSRQQTSFAKFISPEKNGLLADTRTKSATGVQTSAEGSKHVSTPGPELDALSALEKGLEGLKLEQTQTADVVETKKKAKRRKVKTKRDATEAGEDKDLQHEPEKADMKSRAVDHAVDKVPREEATKTSKGRSRRALDDRDAHGTSGTDYGAQHTQPETTLPTVLPSTPVRTLQPRKKAKPKPLPPSQTTHLPTPDSTPEPETIQSAYVSPLVSLSLERKIIPFEQWSSELEPHFEITKIAEASFSEVYRLSARATTNRLAQESVLKVVALKTPPNAPLPCQSQTRAVRDREGQVAKEMAERAENDQWKSEVDDVLSEVKLLQNLNHIPGFTNFRDLTILQGRPSPSFANAWKAWNKERPRGKKSEFPDPSKKTSYDDTQLWAIVEMQDAGTDCEKLMERGGLSSIWEVWDVFWGVCSSVAKAEGTCRFEHRDLHMGNICVRSSQTGADILEPTVRDPLRQKFRFTGLDTTVIDYTLSRADILPSPSRRSSSATISTDLSSLSLSEVTELDVAFLDLNKDPAVFEGDASEEYQYEIYRYMRGAALYNDPLQNAPLEEVPQTPRRSPRKNTHIYFDEVDADVDAPRRSPRKPTSAAVANPAVPAQDIWKQFHPKTNLVWAHFLLHKLLKHLDSHANTPDQLSTRQIMANIEASEQGLEPQKVKKKALKLYAVLKRVSEMLCPVALGRDGSLGSVKELVVLALEERWLRVGDVAG
jgi:serine/threonine-protein kinase haspin